MKQFRTFHWDMFFQNEFFCYTMKIKLLRGDLKEKQCFSKEKSYIYICDFVYTINLCAVNTYK